RDRGLPVALINVGLARGGYEDFLTRMVVELKSLGADPTELLRNFSHHNYPTIDQLDRQVSDESPADRIFQSPLAYKHQLQVLSDAGVDVSQTRVFITEAGHIPLGEGSDPDHYPVDPPGQLDMTMQMLDAWASADQV